MPVHAHDGAKRLKPEVMGQALQELVAAIMVNHGLSNDRAQRGHAFRKPGRNAATVERKIGAAGSSCHERSGSTQMMRLPRHISRWEATRHSRKNLRRWNGDYLSPLTRQNRLQHLSRRAADHADLIRIALGERDREVLRLLKCDM